MNTSLNEKYTLYIDSSKDTASYYLTKALSNIRCEIGSRKIVILCIGTDRATGDSLGPLIGYKLSRMNKNSSAVILGTLENPVHACNLCETINHIYGSIVNPFVVAIDACLGSTEHINHITLSKCSLNPGAGVNKILPSVGDISITGIVNRNSCIGLTTLQSTRLYNVMNMADIITRSISLSIL